jgi:L-ascorbate metabolism protein UlaG (beta-lactamase superfamily)
MLIWILVALLLTPIIIGWSIAAPRYKGAISDHFDGKQFFNPSGQNSKGLTDVAKWQTSTREKTPWSLVQDFEFGEKPQSDFGFMMSDVGGVPKSDIPNPTSDTPSVKNGFFTHLSDLRVTFVGHSTVLLQFDGWNILTDPVWYERCSPFQWVGPKRVQPAGIRFEDLPPIHLILQSHNHWDHLDIENLKKIYQKFKPQIVTSLGISQFLNQHGIEKSVDLDWHDTFLVKRAKNTEGVFDVGLGMSDVGGLPKSDNLNQKSLAGFSELTVTCLPAQHFSGRGIPDRNATLWSSFMVSSPTVGNIYFAGDSGYAPFYKEIGAQFGTIRLALIPIGAYKPEWFMSPIHCSPIEAVQIHLDIKAEQSLAIHHGTFPLADDGQAEPVDVLKSELILRGLAEDDFFVLKEGKFRDL